MISRSITTTAALVVLLFIAACWGKGKPPETQTATKLTVVTTIPLGDIPGRASVDVIFDRPVVAMGTKDPSLQKGREILRIDPEPTGYYHWVGTRALTFVVNEGLPLATHYTAKVLKGLQAADGSVLDHDVTWEFITPRPHLEASIPALGDSLIRPQDPFFLMFNQAVDPKQNADAFELEGGPDLDPSRPDSLALTSAGWGYDRQTNDRMVLLNPKSPLTVDHAYTLHIKKSLKATQGPLDLGEDVRIPFKTFGRPGVIGITARDAAQITFRTPVEPDSVRNYLRIEPSPEKPVRVYGEGTRIAAQGLKPSTEYRITINAGLKDLFGQTMPESKTFTVRTSRRYPFVDILPNGRWQTVVLPLSAKREVILRYTSLTELKLHIETITLETEVQLRNNMPATLGRVGPTTTLYKGKADDDIVTRSISLDTYVAPGKPGAVLIAATGDGIGPEGHAFVQEASVIRFSDLGVTVKGSPERGMVWATSLSSALPRPGTRFSLVSGGGGAYPWKATADANGMSALPGIPDYRQNIFVKAVSGADVALGNLNGNDRLSPWQLGVFYGETYGQNQHRAFIYSDRDLYRPGESVHLNGLVRRMLPSGIAKATLDSVQVRVHEPQGSVLKDTLIALDRLGGVALDIPLSPQAPGGSYWINVTLPQPPSTTKMVPQTSIGSGSFVVAEYRAPSFQVTTRVLERTVTAGDRLEARIQSRYFFGSPVANGRLRWTITRDRTGIYPEGYEDFSFGDPQGNGPQGAVLGSGELMLDGQGSARITSRMPEKPFDGFEQLTFEAGVQDPTGDTVHGRAIVTYSPASVAPGVETPRRVVSTAEPAKIRVVTLRADTALTVPGIPLKLTLYRRDWKSVRKLLVGGRIGYETTTTDTVIGTQNVVSGREPITVTWAIRDPGSYRVEAVAKDAKGRQARAASAFYVTGKQRTEALGAWEEDPFLSITLDKKSYRVGETARAIVSTPVHATKAILSIERESVMESKLVDVRAGSMAFEIPVKASYLPNVFVGVTLVEPELPERDAPNLPAKARLPRMRIGYAELAVDVSPRRLAVTTTPDRAEYRPGDMASLDLNVQTAGGGGAPARVSVAVVDEAVLALLNTPDPDPFSFFYAMRGLSVRNDDTRLSLRQGAEAQLEEEKGEAGGGGEDEAQYRSEFATVAYWNPAVFTDPSGHARVSFKLPDNLTRFRVIAVAASGDDLFGTGKSGFRVTKPVTLDPALPRFALVGDAFEAAVLVTNRTGRSIKGTVVFESNLSGSKRNQESVRLGAGEAKRIAFEAKADKPGDAELRFRAQFETATDAVQWRVPVFEPRTSRTAAAAGRTTASVNEVLELPRQAIPNSSTLDVRLASSIIAGAEEAFHYVLNYPHGCLEQESSRLLAVTLYRRLLRSTKVSWADSLDLDSAVSQAVATLKSMVLPWGTFSFWPGEPNEAPAWALNYAVYAMAQAKRSGAPVPDALLDRATLLTERGLRGLATEAERMRGGKPSRTRNNMTVPATTTAMAMRMEPLGMLLFSATELEGVGPRSVLKGIEVDAFVDMADKLTVEDRVFLALAMQRLDRRPEFVNKVRSELKNHIQITAAGAVVASDVGSPIPPPLRTGTRATALTLLLTTRSQPDDPLATQLAYGLLGLSRQGRWGSTQDNLLALLALVEFRERIEHAKDQVAPFTASVSLPGRPLLQHTFRKDAVEVVQQRVPSLDLNPGTPATLTIAKPSSDQPVYYGAVLRWEEPALGRPPEDGGYSLSRRIERLEDGNDAPRLGELVRVTLECVVPRESWYLALRDPVPAGLEIVHTEFQTESQIESERLARREGHYERLPVTYMDARDRELRAYADYVPPGVYEYRYLARVRATGTFGHPPATLEAMYAPELNAASDSPSFKTSR